MNVITIKANKGEQYQTGDLFKSPDEPEELYMLIEHGSGGYETVSLKTGVSFNSPCKTSEAAVNGLTFYTRNCKIIIE